MNPTQAEYDKDSRTPCKYGTNCYQKNPLHLSKYKHPPKKRPVVQDDVQLVPKRPRVENGDSCSTDGNNTVPSNSSTIIMNDVDMVQSVSSEKAILKDIDEQKFIKSKFLVDMPPDFYSFWSFCQNLKHTNPLMALKEVGLVLVGPFDVLGKKFDNTPEKDIKEYVVHWRYYYDPPEFQTVIASTDNSGYHVGYFRDSPEELPVFLAYNFAKSNGTFTVVGDNLFAAVLSYLDFQVKNANPFMKTTIMRFNNLIQKEAERLKLNLSKKTAKITARNNKMLARTFNKLGFIVPYNKKTQVGYRTLTISNKELDILLNKLRDASGNEKDILMSQLQEVLTNTNIAIDECDFGTGIELGLDMLCSGIEILNSIIARLLSSCYKLLQRDAFAVIIESHMQNRKKDLNLSII
ncbi:histone parylation factor 1 [Holotrichia oblita]|uniref:Histone parylation factor 1 n=1 Tax=Holotrichia oblita TaxID=644536 RepID=A0ACB9TF04_HOLOL|nr:histone parylation factor 1 [Holotrichia oblita]